MAITQDRDPKSIILRREILLIQKPKRLRETILHHNIARQRRIRMHQIHLLPLSLLDFQTKLINSRLDHPAILLNRPLREIIRISAPPSPMHVMIHTREDTVRGTKHRDCPAPLLGLTLAAVDVDGVAEIGVRDVDFVRVDADYGAVF